MSDTPITDAALEELKNAEFITEFQEGSESAKRLTPAEMIQLHELENKIAAEKRRASQGIFRRVL